MKPIELKIIRQFKETSAENPFTLDKLRQWWSEYTGIGSEYLDDFLSHAVRHLLKMVLSVMEKNKISSEIFILALRSRENSYYMWAGNPFLERNTENFDIILLSRIMSCFIGTPVSEIPGWE